MTSATMDSVDRAEGGRQGAESALELAERWHLREIGLWMFLGTLVMLFAAFTSALVVRKSGADWVDVQLPLVLWVNTAVLVMSSVILDRAKRAGRASPRAAARGVAAAGALGAVFFGGQIEAWRQLGRAGVYLPTTPSASFFYVLTGVHAVHVVAALACLGYLLAATRRTGREEWPYLAGTISTFWHFLTFVWIYLLLVLQLA